MEVLEKGETISIHPGQKFPITKVMKESGIVLILIWGVFVVLVLFFLRTGREILPYFIAFTLLLVVPLVSAILIRQSRYYRTVVFDGERGVLSLQGIWRRREVPFDKIAGFQVNRYRFKRDVFLYRLEVVLCSEKILRLIQDVPDKGALSSLGEKIRDLVQKPLNVRC